MTQESLIKRLETACWGLDPVDPLRLLVDDVIEALREHAMREVQRLGQEIEQARTVYITLKLALEALEYWDVHGKLHQPTEEAITAIKEALAQTQEPVAHWSDCAVHSEPAYPKGECDCGGFPSQRTWVGLTDEDKHEIELRAGITEDDDGYIVSQVFKLTEAKLKEKNT
jgi:hypothetical protein